MTTRLHCEFHHSASAKISSTMVLLPFCAFFYQETGEAALMREIPIYTKSKHSG